MSRNLKNTIQLGRRRFLAGASGGLMVLPFLESINEKVFAQSMTQAKRFVFVFNCHGPTWANWEPANVGALPTSGPWSKIYRAGQDSGVTNNIVQFRDKILLMKGIQNLHATISRTQDPGHLPKIATITTCVPQLRQANDKLLAPSQGPSIHHVAGQRLAGNLPMLPSVAVDTTLDGLDYNPFTSAPGVSQTILSGNPMKTAQTLFGGVASGGTTPTVRDRLMKRRSSILDHVAKELKQLKSNISADDRVRLERHEANLAELRTRYSATPSTQTQSCVKPDMSSLPNPDENASQNIGLLDDVTAPAQIDNVVAALACDVTRSFGVVLGKEQFSFPSLFGNTYTKEDYAAALWDPPNPGTWHGAMHTAPSTQAAADFVIRGERWYVKHIERLLSKLSTTVDSAGAPLIDSTLVLWVPELGDGNHGIDYRVFMAGLKDEFKKGQFVAIQQRTFADLYGHALRLLGQQDASFGLTTHPDTGAKISFGPLPI